LVVYGLQLLNTVKLAILFVTTKHTINTKLFFPCSCAANKINKVSKCEFFLQALYGNLAADAVVAINNNRLIGSNFTCLLYNFVKRNFVWYLYTTR
jgi:hypothetical protein